jgi:hypothetical protein
MNQNLVGSKKELPVAAMFDIGSGQNVQFFRGPSIDASYQVSVHLTKACQRRTQAILVSDWLISNKRSPLKPLGQMNQNLVGSIYGRSSIKIANFIPIH